jgi:uncharacterized cupredoxin-like copper-binding protein
VNASRLAQRRPMASVAALTAAAALMLLAACGDDDTETAAVTVATAAPSPVSTGAVGEQPATTAALDEFCEVAAKLNSQDSLPTPEQLAAYQSLAPDEIAEPAAILVAAFESAGDTPQAVFADEGAVAAIEALTAFEFRACGLEPPQGASLTEIDPDATRIDITASDYAFDADFPATAGRYSFVLTNAGAEPHLVVVAHLEPDVALDDILESEGEIGVIEAFESSVAPPGGEAIVTVDLEPGRWVIVCPIPNAAGVSHAELGMVHELTVS